MANKKQRDTAEEEEEAKARKAILGAREKKDEVDNGLPTDILAAEGEEDVIF